MTTEFKKLAERRADEVAPGCMCTKYFLSGALDPVLEEARRAMYRAAILEELADEGNELYPSDLIRLAQAEREKLKKILEGK